MLLIAGGVLVAGDVGWQTWVASPLIAARQVQAADAASSAWSHATAPAARAAPAAAAAATRIPVARRQPAFAATVAVLVVPRFGHGWRRVVRQGVDESAILNSVSAGVGHYPGTALPGGIGNFAIAAHDTGYGDAFRLVGNLRIGDPIYVQTRDGWYTYRFRNLQWVQPTEVGVIAPVPDAPRLAASARLITLTTCDPPYNAQEREIAYGTFEGFHRGATPPPGI